MTDHKNNPQPDANDPQPLLQLDIEKILKNRVNSKAFSKLPSFLFRGLASIICQDQLNHVLREAYPLRGEEFAAKAVATFGVSVETVGLDAIPPGRYLFASNHPLGGLDGMALIASLSERFGPDSVRFPVNDMLMNVTPLAGVFTPLNKYGAQARDAAAALNEAFASSRQIAMFPAGLVSRLQPDGSIADLKWQKTFVVKALEYDRSIVPVFIEALNRPKFYKTAHWRKKLGIGVNIEQALLPSELCHARGMKMRIIFGSPISPDELRAEKISPNLLAAKIRLLSDALRPTNNNNNK